MFRDTDRRPPITPQLALRVAIIGGVALVMFAIVFFRLWYLQILSGDKYLAEANNNRVRNITQQAPRGRIVDRNGQVLVDNRKGYAVQVNPAKLPRNPHQRAQVLRRVATIVGLKPRAVVHDVNKQFKALPFAEAVIKQDVTGPVFAYILEHQDEMPGVDVQQVYLRYYPHLAVGAQLFGTVGEVTAPELGQKRYRGVRMGDRVGQAGIEYSYDRYLRGIDGANRVQVDALGNLRGQLAVRNPQPGRQLRLTLDQNVEQTGQQALAGQRGAFVVMDVHSGEIRALGSSPSFDPNIFAKQIRESDYKRLTDPNNGAPLTNRATQSLYPTGSAFKPITSVAALESGVTTPDTPYTDSGSFTLGGGLVLHNAGKAAYGTLSLPRALQVSSDVFFYHLGAELFSAGNGTVFQKWAGRLGIGRKTGIDLPAETSGVVPNPTLVNNLFKKKLSDHPWSIGDDVNLAVGQGFLGVDPLQLAVAYSAIANGGDIVRPHLGLRVEDAAGRAIQDFQSSPKRHVKIQSPFRQAILSGLQAAAESPGGTSYPVFGADKGFPIRVAGKTGTAQKGLNRADQSWYVCLAPYPNPRYVVVVTSEAGGFGAQTAAPEVKRILATLFNVHLKAGQAQVGSQSNVAGVNANG